MNKSTKYVPKLLDPPIILFIGGSGGAKSKYGSQVNDSLQDRGLVHICMPDLIQTAFDEYKDNLEWSDAAKKHEKGESIPTHLALSLIKEEMHIFPNAKAYFLEGYPIEINQVKEFERQFKTISSAIIMDYDEEVLKKKLRNNGLSEQIIKARINQFVQKLFPTTLYFYDQNVLHFVLGDKDDSVVYKRIMKLVIRAMESNQPSSTQVL